MAKLLTSELRRRKVSFKTNEEIFKLARKFCLIKVLNKFRYKILKNVNINIKLHA